MELAPKGAIFFMATSRYVNTSFWKDNYVVDLDPSEKLLFLYFLTNPKTNIAGVYEIHLREAAFDTGFDIDMIKKILGRFQADGKMDYVNGWLIIKNFVKHQRINPSVRAGIERAIAASPKELGLKLLEHNNRGQTTVSLQSGYSLSPDSPQSGTLNLNSNLTINLNSKSSMGGELARPVEVISSLAVDRVSTKEIDHLMDTWEAVVGFKLKTNVKKNREYAGKLIKENSITDIEKMIQGVNLAADDQYAPRIANFVQLYRKWDDLKIWGRRQMSKQTQQQQRSFRV